MSLELCEGASLGDRAKEGNAVLLWSAVRAALILCARLEVAGAARHLGDGAFVLEEAEPRRETEFAARKAQEGTAQIDGELDDVVPRAEEEDVVAARVDDVDVALRLLFPAKEGEGRGLLSVADTADTAAAEEVDVVLEKE